MAVKNANLVAACGLYCGACGSYLKGKCKGCKENVKAAWCKIRACCIDSNYKSCADCNKTPLQECKKFNNMIGKIVGFILNSDRAACINRIKEAGYDQYVKEMAESERQSIRKR
ncbi:MAG: DUF3795 domain-containing protein [Endomicrobia bacterium]|nr:DUF3795 domain-containing protein [Endomicrobiia bacterium]